MKILKRLAAAVASIALLSSCSILKSVATSALTSGSNTGAAISQLATALGQAGNIDLGSITNIINLGQILRGAKSVTGANASYLDTFINGMIQGSANKINTSNVNSVISGLQSLAGMDTAALKNAATKAALTGAVSAVNPSDPGVSQALSQVTSILGLLK
ncbi:MAG: hypothetical protein IJV37_04380 [Bacteroidales bacterium]|nr:hypothetical protein [Bacteroidales bacterium]